MKPENLNLFVVEWLPDVYVAFIEDANGMPIFAPALRVMESAISYFIPASPTRMMVDYDLLDLNPVPSSDLDPKE